VQNENSVALFHAAAIQAWWASCVSRATDNPRAIPFALPPFPTCSIGQFTFLWPGLPQLKQMMGFPLPAVELLLLPVDLMFYQ
jgi:hypothetical protein